MKKIFYTCVALLIAHTATSQVIIDSIECNTISVGSVNPQQEAINTIKDLRFLQSKNQLALVASKDSVNTYYFIYDQYGQMLKKGRFKKDRAGEYSLIDLGSAIGTDYKVVFSTKEVSIIPSIVKTTF